MRRFWVSVVAVLLFTFSFFPCTAISADNGPSNLALLLQEAFSQPNAPTQNRYPFDIQGITYYKGILAVFQKDTTESGGYRNNTWIFFQGNWTKVASGKLFSFPPDSFHTIFDKDCTQLGTRELDMLAGNFSNPNIQSLLDVGLYRLQETGPFGTESVVSAVGGPAISGIASFECMVAVVIDDNLRIYLPSEESNVSLTERIVGPPWGEPPDIVLPLRNGETGILDGILPGEETFKGIEFDRNNRDIVALLVLTDENVYLLEYELTSTVVTKIPLR